MEDVVSKLMNSFDGDGRDKEYWEVRELLLSWQTPMMLVRKAGVDGHKTLEILVHAYMIGAANGSLFDQKTREILNMAQPLLDAELAQEEESQFSPGSRILVGLASQ